jgi:hypothetical protein
MLQRLARGVRRINTAMRLPARFQSFLQRPMIAIYLQTKLQDFLVACASYFRDELIRGLRVRCLAECAVAMHKVY